MGKRYTKKFLESLIIKEMQIKTAIRYYLTPFRMTIINKTRSNKCWQECEEKGTTAHCWWECKLVQQLWKTVWRFLKKLKTELPYDPAVSFLGIHPMEMKSLSWRDICTPMFIAALLIVTKVWKQSKCPLTGEWIKKME